MNEISRHLGPTCSRDQTLASCLHPFRSTLCTALDVAPLLPHAAGLLGHSFISGINHMYQTASLLHTGSYSVHVFQHKSTPGLQTMAESQMNAQNQLETLKFQHHFPGTVTCTSDSIAPGPQQQEAVAAAWQLMSTQEQAGVGDNHS